MVLGVHSAKFPAEREPARVREAMARYGVSHPVVVDTDHQIWQSYAIRAWPTLVFLRPDGTLAETLSGERDEASLVALVEALLDEGRRLGTLGRRRPVELAPGPTDSGQLSFPSKVIATPEGLALCDTGHHRVLQLDPKGAIQSSIGDGAAGFRDGPRETARFRMPHGLAVDSSSIYVADTGNHALRAIDLETGVVTTVAGTGELGKGFPKELLKAGEAPLRSPWDLVLVNGVLLVAMAGAHQIWAYLPEEEGIAVLAGTGRESIEDGPFETASFAQPMGIAARGQKLYVADSETSAIRELDLDTARVRTLVGKGLFVFGDEDGPPDRAKLQHVQGISIGPHGILAADTFNDKIKRVDPETGRVETWFPTEGLDLSEPEGILQLGLGQVVVADTNHHRLLLIDGETKESKVIPILD